MLPSELTRGPWKAEHQRGEAVAGLWTRELDRMDSPVPMRLAGVTVEMFRGGSLRSLLVETEFIRAGRRIESVEARLAQTR